MKAVFLAIQALLESNVPELKYIDEDWGQLDAYSPHPPAKFPLALIDLGDAIYQNLGIDRKVSPMHRQTAEATVVITIANQKLTNTSSKAPAAQKDAAWFIQDIIQKVHEQLQGKCVTETDGALIRTSARKIRRDDGIQEYEITYTIGMTNV